MASAGMHERTRRACKIRFLAEVICPHDAGFTRISREGFPLRGSPVPKSRSTPLRDSPRPFAVRTAREGVTAVVRISTLIVRPLHSHRIRSPTEGSSHGRIPPLVYGTSTGPSREAVDRLERLETRNTITEPISFTGMSLSVFRGLAMLGVPQVNGGSAGGALRAHARDRSGRSRAGRSVECRPAPIPWAPPTIFSRSRSSPW